MAQLKSVTIRKRSAKDTEAFWDAWMLKNLPRYKRIIRDLEAGKGIRMTGEEFVAWSQSLRKKYGH
jgi:hypothetical protein